MSEEREKEPLLPRRKSDKIRQTILFILQTTLVIIAIVKVIQTQKQEEIIDILIKIITAF